MKEIYSIMNPKTVNYGSSGGGSYDAVSFTDVAAAIASAPDPMGSMLIHYVVCGNKSARGQLLEEFSRRLYELAGRKNWRVQKTETIQLLANAVITELYDLKCPKCKGTGMVGDGPKTRKKCSKCEGTGDYTPSNIKRALSIGIKPQSFEPWKERFEDAKDLIRNVEISTDAAVGKKLRK